MFVNKYIILAYKWKIKMVLNETNKIINLLFLWEIFCM